MNIRSLFNRLAPPACLLCGAASTAGPLCPGCLDDLPWHRAPACPRCALPTPDGRLCGACLRHPPAFDRTCAALVYRFPVDRMIPRFKYHAQLALAPALGHSLADRVADAPRPDLAVAMPLHPARIRARGFNHAAEIARSVTHRLGLPLDLDACRRIRDTPPQQGLKRDARRRNLRGAFACAGDVAGLRIAIIDDVMTTGASLDALAAALKRAGAADVDCWVVARALPPA